MRLHRFYISKPLGEENFILEEKEILNQLLKVFRAKINYNLILFNCLDDFDYVYEIKNIFKNKIKLNLKTKIKKEKIHNKNLTLCLAILKKDNFEKAVGSAVQIGVNNIIPLITSRIEKKDLNFERLNKIIIKNTEQSGRNDLLKLEKPLKIKDVLEKSGKHIVFDTKINNSNNPENDNVKNQNIYAYIGPEGGWSETEIELFNQNKTSIIKLNTYTLKAETASTLISYYIVQL